MGEVGDEGGVGDGVGVGGDEVGMELGGVVGVLGLEFGR